MSWKRTGDWDKVPSILEEAVKRVERAVLFNFYVIGEGSVNHARENGSYKDRTSNLRNSIGYVIAYNGEIIEYGFKRSAGITDKDAFLADYKIQEMIGDSGFDLIIVAGMNYARHVENKGYDVLSSTEKYLKREVQAKIKRILSKAGFNQ